MREQQQMVLKFHRMFDMYLGAYPQIPPDSEQELSMRLVREEFRELIEAMEEQNLNNIAKEAADLMYVIYALANRYGFDMQDVFNEVHRSNMTKVGGHFLNGKLIKPKTYEPANIERVLHGW